MSQSRENPDGSMTYWQDGADEPPKAADGKATVKAEPEVEAKVVETPEPKKASGKSRAQTKG